MSKTATVFTRVEPEVKEQAEAILNELGIPLSSAINLYLRQIIRYQGIPFSLSLRPVPSNLAITTPEDIEAALRQGLEDVEQGRLHSLSDVKQSMKERYGL